MVLNPQGLGVSRCAATLVILLDTNGLIWLVMAHARARPLMKSSARMFVSPATLLEIQYLIEAGRLRFKRAVQLSTLYEDERWTIDDPPAVSWFETALDLGWTTEPFDRLIVAHARLRGWRLATADAVILEHLAAREVLEL